MKKRNLIITTLLVVVAATVAFVSCKKENQDALLNNTESVMTFTVPQIDDMNAYLKGFKQRMRATKDGETLTLDEAAWHLSCLANFDFCRINVEYDDFQFDTIDMQVMSMKPLLHVTSILVVIRSTFGMVWEQLHLKTS